MTERIAALVKRLTKADEAITGTVLARMQDVDAARATVVLKAVAQELAALLTAQPAPVTDDALLASAAAGGWQLIATAPKDGTDVLVVYGIRPDVGIAHYSESAHLERADIDGWLHSEGAIGAWVFKPTHWQPLPAPPASPDRKEQG